MSKEIIYDEDALLSIAAGASTLAKAVKTTYGPRGRHVAIGKNGSCFLTRDGATVAESITCHRAVLHSGVVPGGGIAYIEASWMVIRQKYDSNAAQIGANILYSALEAPFIALAENSGLEPLPLIVTLHESELGTGYNLDTGEITNMREEYILDPTEVTRLALENAVSVVSELIGTSVAIYDAVSDDTSHL